MTYFAQIVEKAKNIESGKDSAFTVISGIAEFLEKNAENPSAIVNFAKEMRDSEETVHEAIVITSYKE